MPASVLAESAAAGGSDATSAFRPPRVEYLATLSRHSAAVNVVRFSPNGECVFQFMRRSGIQVARMVGCQMTPLTSTGGIPLTRDDRVRGDRATLLSLPLLNTPLLSDLHQNPTNPIPWHDNH